MVGFVSKFYDMTGFTVTATFLYTTPKLWNIYLTILSVNVMLMHSIPTRSNMCSLLL